MNAWASVGVGAPDRDGDAWDDEEDNCRARFDLENEPGSCGIRDEEGSHCITEGSSTSDWGATMYCNYVPGPRPDWLEGECFGEVGDGRCPGGPDAVACIDNTPTEGAFTEYVYYGITDELDAAQESCRMQGDRWVAPYVP
jgi:hypothetical protein